MRDYFKENRIILILLIVILVACFSVIGSRMLVEKNNKAYDVVLDYNEIVAMADQSDQDIAYWLKVFKELGSNKAGLSEESIISLMEESEYKVAGEMVDSLLHDANWYERFPKEFIEAVEERGYDIFDVMVTAQGEIVDFLETGITERIDPDRYIMYEEGDHLYIFLDGTADLTLYSEKYKYQNSDNTGYQERIDIVSSKIMYISLGFLPEKVKSIKDADMEIVPRTMSYNGWNGKRFAEAVVKGYEDNGIDPDYIIVGGQAVFGFDEGPDFAKDYIMSHKVTLGLIENTNQRQNIMQYGVDEVAEASSYDSVRVFTVWPYIQNRYQYYDYEGAKEIENTLYRAVVERNIRVIYYRPIFENEDLHTYVTDVNEYKELFSNLERRLAGHGFYPGTASQMVPYEPVQFLKILMGMASVLGALLLLGVLFRISKKCQLILGLLASLGVIGMSLKVPELYELTASFFAAVIFSSVAISYFTYQAKLAQDKMEQGSGLARIMVLATGTLLASVLLALLGGLISAAPISSIEYMLEMNIFRGVKAAQLLPMIYFVLAYLAFFGYGENKKTVGRLELGDIRELLNMTIKAWMVLLGLVLLALGAYYIIRTGHSSTLKVSGLEMIFRNELEDILLARPRSKEFLIAFPAIIVMVYGAVRRFKVMTIIAGLGGVIGMTSVVNTFQHIRTPIYLGIFRTAYGFVFGLLIGLVLISLIDYLYKYYLKHKGRAYS